MGYIVLYFGAMLLGYVAGSKQRHRAEKFSVIVKIQSVCIFLMVFIMGMRMGSNEEIIRNLGTIELKALVITAGIFILSALSITVTRKIMKIDKWGRTKTDAGKEEGIHAESFEENTDEQSSESANHKTTILIIVAVIIGLTAGYFIIRPTVDDIEAFYSICTAVMTSVLTLMLFIIGLDMGLAGKVAGHLKEAGVKVMIFPLVVLVATTLTGVLAGLLIPGLSVKLGLAVCYGYGWYTFAPIAIASEGYITASAISFMHNVFRELIGIILIPLLAKRIGYIEVCSFPGTAGADIAMPVVSRATRPDIIVYSFSMGMISTLFVPILVPLVIGL